MVTIAQLVEKEVSRKPYLQEALLRGLINYGALADELLPGVQREFSRPVKHSAVMMALRRLSEKLTHKSPKTFTFTTDISITINSHLFIIAHKKSPSIHSTLQSVYETVDYSSGDVLAINIGNNEVTIISNTKHYKNIKAIMEPGPLIQDTKDVAAVSLSLSFELMDKPGFFYLVTRALTWENINILEVVSTPTELTLIVREKDATKAYETLRDLFR